MAQWERRGWGEQFKWCKQRHHCSLLLISLTYLNWFVEVWGNSHFPFSMKWAVYNAGYRDHTLLRFNDLIDCYTATEGWSCSQKYYLQLDPTKTKSGLLSINTGADHTKGHFWKSYVILCVCRSSQGQKEDNTLDSQVVQYEPAHHGSINTVTSLSPEVCVSGGTDQVFTLSVSAKFSLIG